MNSAFVLFSPEVCTEPFLESVGKFLSQAGARVEEVVCLTGADIKRNNLVERHYAIPYRHAMSSSAELAGLIHDNESVKSHFFSAYGELWDAVIEEGRLVTARDVMALMEDMSPQALNEMWWAPTGPQGSVGGAGATHAPTRLFDGLYVCYLEKMHLYVVNGFFPALYERFTGAEERQACWMSVTWPESLYTWEQFLVGVMGTSDPTCAAPTSLRHALYHRHHEWDIPLPPSQASNGFDVSQGPLEALALRCIWTGRQLHEDGYSRTLLQEGLPSLFVQRVLLNPMTVKAGCITSVFDKTAKMPGSQVARYLSEWYVELQRAAADGQEAEQLVYDLEAGVPVDLTAGCEEESVARNSALVLVKPQAHGEEVFRVVEETLLHSTEGMTLDRIVDVDGSLIKSKGIIDRHYRAIAHYACDAVPCDLSVSEESQETFNRVFGVSWAEQVATGRVWNATTALHMLGELTAEQLFDLWDTNTTKVKLCSGAYVCRLTQDVDVFVINGFYPCLREAYCEPTAQVRCYAVSWPEGSRSWSSFRSDVIGCTDPSAAPSTSLRGIIYERWSTLGLARQPNTTENAIHASASPLEAMMERHLWLGAALELDVLCMQLQRTGVSAAIPLLWATNPAATVCAPGAHHSTVSQRVWEAVENMEQTEVVRVMREAERLALAAVHGNPINRAVVVLHPYAVTTRTISLVQRILEKSSIHIRGQSDLFSHAAAHRVLDTPEMQAASRYAALQGQALMDAVPLDAHDSLRAGSGIDWEVYKERICGGEAVCASMQVTPLELMQKWASQQPLPLSQQCYVAFLPEYQLYVVNGFYPYLRESYHTPGCRAHCFDVEWAEASWTWRDVADVIIGNPDSQKAAPGSLQSTISDEWKELGLARRPCHCAPGSISISVGPLEAIADRVVWLADSAHERVEQFQADPFTQHLLMEGVPLGLIEYYARGFNHCKRFSMTKLERQLLTEMSTFQQSSEAAQRMRAVAAHVQRACKWNYAFLWVEPSSAKDAFKEMVPKLLGKHHVQVRSQGEVHINDAVARNLLNSPFSALYRNAQVYTAAQLPLSQKELDSFRQHFGISWQVAVQLSLVLNADEAARRFGETKLIDLWDAATTKARLSPDLYVGLLENEGLYVVNGFYPFLRARRHTGPRAFWFSVAWEADRFSWAHFLHDVVGDTDVTVAVEGSLRHQLFHNWEVYGLSFPPNDMVTGVQASPSPMAALAERTLWWNLAVEEDVLGRLLLQRGVQADFLYDVATNPRVYRRGQPLSDTAHMFDLLPSSTEALAQALLEMQNSNDIFLLPPDVVLTHPASHLGDKDQDAARQEARDLSRILLKAVSTVEDYPGAIEGAVENESETPAKGIRRDVKFEYALLYLSPHYTSSGHAEVLLDGVCDFLRSRSVEVVLGGVLHGEEAVKRGVFEIQHKQLLRYAMRRAAEELVVDEGARSRFEAIFGEALDPTRVLSAQEVAEEFNLTARQVDDLWQRGNPIGRIGPNCFVAKLPTDDMYIVNGFVPYARDRFQVLSQHKHYILVAWEASWLTYEQFLTDVIGDSFIKEVKEGSLHDALRKQYRNLGLPSPPHACMGVVQASDSALSAMLHRQLWLGLGARLDPLGRIALSGKSISPYVLHATLAGHIPSRTDSIDAQPPILQLAGLGTTQTLQFLQETEQAYRGSSVRNTAFVIVKPHAVCSRFANRIESIFAAHGIHIDEEGDLPSHLVRERGLVRCINRSAASYSVRDPRTIALTREESARVEAVFSISWQELLLGGLLVNAYEALECLGDISPQQLYTAWKAARHSLEVRPDLIITELEEHQLFVVNAYFPAMKQSFESERVLLHWYQVSWVEKEQSWGQFMHSVIGNRNPTEAAPSSIRGYLFSHWRQCGMRVMPDKVQNGVHASEGPLQAMCERLTCLQRSMLEDPLGDLLLRRSINEQLVRFWMDNPDVTSDGVHAGTFEHLTGLDTSRLVQHLERLTDEMLSKGSAGCELELPAPPISALLPAIATGSCIPDTSTHQCTGFGEDHCKVVAAVYKEARVDRLLHSNTAVLLVKPHISRNDAAWVLLREILQQHKIRVVNSSIQEGSTRLVERTNLIRAFFAFSHQVAGILRGCEEVSEKAKERFIQSFGESWDSVIDPAHPRLLSAADAMGTLRLSPQELYQRVTHRDCVNVHLGYDMNVAWLADEDVYLLNGTYPYEQQRMEDVSYTTPGKATYRSNVVGVVVVTWDERELSWGDFRRAVVGAEDPAEAAPSSFRGQLLSHWQEFGLEGPPDTIDNGIHESAGALHAFWERYVWTGAPEVIPDPLVRSVEAAGVDAAALYEWRENPLVICHDGASQQIEGKPISRIFDLLIEANTGDVIDRVRSADSCLTIIHPPTGLRILEGPRGKACGSHAHRAGTASPKRADTHRDRDGSQAREQTPVADPTGPKMRTRLRTTLVHDSLLHARTADDVQQLWAHYLSLKASPPSMEAEGIAARSEGDVAATEVFIDARAFRRDFDAIENFGIPMPPHLVAKYFKAAEERGGRMYFNEFACILAAYQAM